VIALDVSSAVGPPPHGGIGGATRRLAEALARVDPGTRYLLAVRPSRWRRGGLVRIDAPNARPRLLLDPWNAVLLRGARLLHALSTGLPRTPRVPKLVTLWDVNPLRNPQWVSERWRERRGARLREAAARADLVVATSRHAAAEIEALLGVPPARVRVVPLGVDVERFRRPADVVVEAQRRRHGDFVLAVALLAPRKNLVRLVEAVSRVPALRLIVVGRESRGAGEFFEAVERHRMRERTTHLARVPADELVALLAAARLLAVPSLYEGFGLTVLEAMACGTPVVCSTAPALLETAGDAALTVDATDAEALATGLCRVLESSELAGDLRTRGLARARAMSWDAAARALRAVYGEVLGERTPSV
jgi:glycosyltransferase involved in cell wall biosynthesis